MQLHMQYSPKQQYTQQHLQHDQKYNLETVGVDTFLAQTEPHTLTLTSNILVYLF